MQKFTKEWHILGAIALNKKLKNDRKLRAKQLRGLINSHRTKEFREKNSKIKKKFWANKKNREKLSRKIKKLFSNIYYRKKIDRGITKWWREHPNIREKRSREIREFFVKHPEEFRKKFAAGENNPFRPHLKTKLGLVRSMGEKKIADFLVLNKIRAEYENKVLVLDGWVCVPDFYLPKHKFYIEYYGGYPGSWKKKVLKNKLYKKHKIKCIFITPAELTDLHTYLFNELD